MLLAKDGFPSVAAAVGAAAELTFGMQTFACSAASARSSPDYDGLILDLWGVVHDGNQPFPGVLDRWAGWLPRGKPRRAVLERAAPAPTTSPSA